MVDEEKGFVIKDRRSLDEEGELKEEKPQDPAEVKGEAKEKPSEGDQTERPPLPEVNFNSLIFSLSSSALLHLGEIADPHSGEKTKDLALAKHAIDTIGMLKEKTKGNLAEEEGRFIESVLADLRWRYIKEAK